MSDVAVGRLETLADGFAFTEGPVWNDAENALYFSDIPNSRILRWQDGDVSTHRAPSNMANGMASDGAGSLIVCEHATSSVSRLHPDGTVERLASTFGGRELNSPNDVVVRSDGLIYFTDPLYGRNPFFGIPRSPELDFQGVYLIRPGADEPQLLLNDFIAPNGLCFSDDESLLYVNDSERMHIRVFEVAPDGSLGSGEVFFTESGEPTEGVPDGMKIDMAGNVVCTGPRGLWWISPGGELLSTLEVPEIVGNFCFGGADRRDLYICASTSLYRTRPSTPGYARA